MLGGAYSRELVLLDKTTACKKNSTSVYMSIDMRKGASLEFLEIRLYLYCYDVAVNNSVNMTRMVSMCLGLPILAVMYI